MKKLIHIVVGSLIVLIGLGMIVFAAPLILPPDNWVSVGAFVVMALIGAWFGVNGIKILLGESLMDVFSELFRGLGR